ncbi:MAG: SDR family NAD(P)-dependent oxidoreductase [Bosea sp. (in: a-proteobacteria)]
MKKIVIVLHDLAMTALAVWLAFVVRFDGVAFDERIKHLPGFLPLFVAAAGIVYWFFSLYESKWRFASLPDLSNIVRAVTVVTVGLLIVDYVLVAPNFYGFFFFGKITIALYWLLQLFLLGGPRLAYRYLKYAQSKQSAAREATMPTLLLGRGVDVEVVLRAIETGAIKRLKPVGILSPREADIGQAIRGVRVVGSLRDLERIASEAQERGESIRRVVATPSALSPDADPERWLARARKLAVPISRLDNLDRGVAEAALAPLEIEDLLLRPTVEVDRGQLQRFLERKRIAVTGGGGSIGSEICLRCALFGAAELLVIESSEPALFHVTELLAAQGDAAVVTGAIADVRDAERIERLLTAFRPDIVVHAAALKHVPYLEADWTEGIRTNIFGSINVADAALKAGAKSFVMISTDKAIEPVSMLGATKRFAEIYAQALDAEQLAARGKATKKTETRMIAVRFGNVLGSAGSVVPKFKAQIARGGPLTVTHPDMIRYFMTIREACDLVLAAGAHARDHARDGDVDERAAVYVLKMGQPVRINDLAERMIRLAGFEPGEDIEIRYTGVRPGERLHEILFARDEPMAEIGLPGVMAAKPVFASRAQVNLWLKRLAAAVAAEDRKAAEVVLDEAIPDFSRREVKAQAMLELPAPQAPNGLAQAASSPAKATLKAKRSARPKAAE